MLAQHILIGTPSSEDKITTDSHDSIARCGHCDEKFSVKMEKVSLPWECPHCHKKLPLRTDDKSYDEGGLITLEEGQRYMATINGEDYFVDVLKVVKNEKGEIVSVTYGEPETNRPVQTRSKRFIKSIRNIPSYSYIWKEQQNEPSVETKPKPQLPRKLTASNAEKVEHQFLELSNTGNYMGAEKFDDNRGLTLEWGKYGYSALESERDDDWDTLVEDVHKFNNAYSGVYVAFAVWNDKVLSVEILDLRQISLSEHFMNKLARNLGNPDKKKAYDTIMQHIKDHQ
ncbi:MAG TPA: hypothetical protein VEA58_10585 [Anaerovoracaceae bacterium]|nr:hypothetical protein [Anaerovoracaceae bacterium]